MIQRQGWIPQKGLVEQVSPAACCLVTRRMKNSVGWHWLLVALLELLFPATHSRERERNLSDKEQFGTISICGVMLDLEQLRLGPTSGVQSAPFRACHSNSKEIKLIWSFYFSFSSSSGAACMFLRHSRQMQHDTDVRGQKLVQLNNRLL